MSEDKLLIPSTSIKLLDCIGQGKAINCNTAVEIISSVTFVSIVGEFGVVYRAHLNSYEGRCEPGLVAVKTLKGTHAFQIGCINVSLWQM